MKKVVEATAKLKNKYGDKITIISGIVATAEAAEAHFEAGSDCVATGVGSGSICITRIQTGSGVPGFQTLLDIAPVARKHGKTFLPLAGLKNSGDVVKSLAAGASVGWGGYLFAGTDETPGEIVEINGNKYKKYNGSTSKREKIKQVGKLANGSSKSYIAHVEGVESLVPYRGPVADVVEELLAGIRSGLSYSGALNIPQLWEKAQFIRITNVGVREGFAHDVTVSS